MVDRSDDTNSRDRRDFERLRESGDGNDGVEATDFEFGQARKDYLVRLRRQIQTAKGDAEVGE